MPTLIATLFFSLLLLFSNSTALVSPVFASTYWVSPAGQASWTACQSETPLAGTAACAITMANTNAAAGDKVYLRGGTYTNDVFIAPAKSGTAANPIIFSAYNAETVLVNNQKVPNSNHENAAWTAWNGAIVEHSPAQAWDGAYSTKFKTSTSGQGISSGQFNVSAAMSGLTWTLSVRVYSDQSSVNLQVRKVDDSAVPLDKNYTIVPNQWNVLEAVYSVGWASSGNFRVVIASNDTAPSGTWYVDGVRSNFYQASIYLNGKDYIVVDGIRFESVWRGFELRNGADYNEIKNCSFTDLGVYSANIIWDANASPSRYNWIHNCTFYESGYVKRNSTSTDCDDIQTLLRVGNGTSTDSSSFNVIENNQFYRGGHDLVILATKFNTFRNNIMHNEGWILNRGGQCASASGGYNNPGYFGNRGLLIENPGNNGGSNLIEGNRIGFLGTPPDDDGANGIENPADGNIVRYNFLFKAGASGFYFKAQPGIYGTDVLPDNNVVYNNTIYKNGAGQDISSGFQGGLLFVCGSMYTPTHPAGNIITNNIVYDNTATVLGRTCEGYTYVNNFEQDPVFVNADLSDPTSVTLPNLTLKAGSPAIDGAAALTTVKSGDAGTGTTVAVENARFFQDGSWGPPGKVAPDVIAIGQTGNTAQIVSVDHVNNLIVLDKALTRKVGDSVWLSQKSDGANVLVGSGPDFGASEYGSSDPSDQVLPPKNLRLQ